MYCRVATKKSKVHRIFICPKSTNFDNGETGRRCEPPNGVQGQSPGIFAHFGGVWGDLEAFLSTFQAIFWKQIFIILHKFSYFEVSPNISGIFGWKSIFLEIYVMDAFVNSESKMPFLHIFDKPSFRNSQITNLYGIYLLFTNMKVKGLLIIAIFLFFK